jgi:recombinational DNA repair protein RecR
MKMTEQRDRIWDFTTLDTFLTCRRKYYWRMVRHLVPKTVAPALEFGKAIHLGLEAYYNAKKNGVVAALDPAIKAFVEGYKDREGEELRTVENGIKLLTGYALVYQNEPIEVTDVEVGFVVPIKNESPECVHCGNIFTSTIEEVCSNCKESRIILYGGRLDALVKWDGQLFVLETKTTAMLRGSFFKQFEPNMQVDGYTLAAIRYTGKHCVGVIINALEPWKEVKRPTEKTKKLEDHFARHISSRSDKDLVDFSNQAHQIIRDIKLCEDTGEFYQNKHACFNYNYECPYKQLCLYGDDQRLVDKDYIVEKWEPFKEEVKHGE